MVFIVAILLLWILYTIAMKKAQGSRFEFSNAVLPLVLFSFIISICLGINFSASTALADGSYSINNTIAYWIIGEDGWSYAAFKSYFDSSIIASIILTLIYSALKIFDR